MNDELVNQAQQLLENNQFEQAISLLQRILAENPKHQESLHGLGLAYARSGQVATAITYFKQAQAIKEDAQLLNNLANAYLLNQQRIEAIAHYQRAIALQPDYAQAHNNLANIYAKENHYELALQHYIKATHAAPDFTNAHFNLGLLLLKNNQGVAAKTQFTNVLSLNPDALDALFYLGILHLDAQELDEAEQAFQSLLLRDNEHVQALVNLGVIALKRQCDQVAVDYFSKALALDNEHKEARNNLAATFMHHDRFENALMHYDVLLQKEPDNIEYLYNSGVAQMALGHLNEATLLFDHILELNPHHAHSLNNLAAIYLKQEQRETARAYLEKALDVNPEDTISRHMHHALSGIKAADSPPEYAQNLFNNYALYYDKHMQEALNYSLPTHIGRTIHQLELLSIPKTLDLGCGTGLSGIVVRESTKHLTGVDIAEKMLDHAKKRAIYDRLVHHDVIHFLQEELQNYDLILAADVLPYFGDLTLFIELVSQHMTPNAYFICSIELCEKDKWQLNSSVRFSHNPDYVQELALKNGLTIIMQEKIPARMHNHKPLEVILFIIQKVSCT